MLGSLSFLPQAIEALKPRFRLPIDTFSLVSFGQLLVGNALVGRGGVKLADVALRDAEPGGDLALKHLALEGANIGNLRVRQRGVVVRLAKRRGAVALLIGLVLGRRAPREVRGRVVGRIAVKVADLLTGPRGKMERLADQPTDARLLPRSGLAVEPHNAVALTVQRWLQNAPAAQNALAGAFAAATPDSTVRSDRVGREAVHVEFYEIRAHFLPHASNRPLGRLLSVGTAGSARNNRRKGDQRRRWHTASHATYRSLGTDWSRARGSFPYHLFSACRS